MPRSYVPEPGEVLETLFRNSHSVHRQFEALLTELGLPAYVTGPRLRFLITVFESGRIRMNDMAAKLGIQARTVTQFVDALEEHKLLIRLPDPEDRRATLLQVSESAPPLIAQARVAMSRAAAQVLQPLSPEMRSHLFEALRLLARKGVQE